MKKIEGKNPNKMKIETGHKTFDRQTRLISTGNQIGNTVVSWCIRAYSETINPLGQECPLGHLQNFDLNMFTNPSLGDHFKQQIRPFLVDRAGILYRLFHYNDDRKIIHGYILTTNDHLLLKSWVNPHASYKSWNVLAECEKYVTRKPNPEGEKRLAQLQAWRTFLWDRANKHDGVDPKSMFVVHSDDNPFQRFYDKVTKEYLAVYNRLKYDEPLEEACPHTRPYSWQAYDGEWVVCCCDCGAVLKGAAE